MTTARTIATIAFSVAVAVAVGVAITVSSSSSTKTTSTWTHGSIVTDFPDKEVCSLACGVGWETRVQASGEYTADGWAPDIGDKVHWIINQDAKGTYRFDGFYTFGGGISEARLRLNGSVIPLSIRKEGDLVIFRTDHDRHVSANDVITVEILAIMGDGHVASIQPTGVH